MKARIILVVMVVGAMFAGLAMYYLQVYAFYSEVAVTDTGNVQLTLLGTEVPEPVYYADFKGIDSPSSPIRYRDCFTTDLSQALLTETYVTYPAADPLLAPRWFDCFDAAAIGAALETGEAIAFLGVGNIHYGIDRVVAILPDGRGYSWQQINACGEVVFNGEPVPEGCPPLPESPN